MAKYPKREQYYAVKVMKALSDRWVANDIGTAAALLVSVVAAAEDDQRYSGPVTFTNGQIMPKCGIRSWATLKSARAKAMKAGWLCYEQGNSQNVAQYWTLIPNQFETEDDSSSTEVTSKIEKTLRKSREVTEKKLSQNIRPFIPIPEPNPTPEPKEKSASASSSDSQKSKNKFSGKDMETATHIWNRIHAMHPKHKKPNLESWANDCRLMREQDNRGSPEARELFDWANQHDFWKPNILSPAKLRKHWDKLEIQRNNDNDNHKIEAAKSGRHYSDWDYSQPGGATSPQGL